MKNKGVRIRISYKTIFLLFKVLKDSYVTTDIEKFKSFLRSYNVPNIIQKLLEKRHAPSSHAPYDVSANFIENILKSLYGLAVEKSAGGIFKLLLQIIEATLIEFEKDDLGIMIRNEEVKKDIRRLLSSLELDGFRYVNHKVIAIESQVVEIEEIKSDMVEKIKSNPELNHPVLMEHLGDCENSYLNGSWKNSISNARHFMEELLLDIAKAGAEALGEKPPKSGSGEAGRVRGFLVDKGFFEQKECDDLINGVYSYLSEEGSHRGLTKHSCARASRIIILSLGFYVLEKFENWKQKEYKSLYKYSNKKG